MNVDSSKITSVQTAGRICRFAPNKVAEMFTLVLKGTQEVKWFNNSNTTECIVLDTEEKLKKVLNHEEIESREREFSENLQFRF
jgi:ERCC4-related helicase